MVWRKLYESRLNGDPVKGYKLDSNTYVHYALMDGEYKKQTTSGTTIKGWLAAKGLAWQKGYPQSSECAGQTGKPIPEMVDPLLNDPDVLKWQADVRRRIARSSTRLGRAAGYGDMQP